MKEQNIILKSEKKMSDKKRINRKPRILVSAFGVGFGHSTRTFALVKELKKFANVKIVGYDLSYKYFEKMKMNPIKLKVSVKYRDTAFSFSLFSAFIDNIRVPFSLNKNYEFLSNLINKFKPDLIISDSDPFLSMTAKFKEIPIVMIINWFSTLNEYKYLLPRLKQGSVKNQHFIISKLMNVTLKNTDLILNPSFGFEKSIISRLKYTGVIVRKKPNDLAKIETLRKKHDLPEEYYLVSFGGSCYGKSLLKQLMPIFMEYKDKTFVISTNNMVRKKQVKKNLILYPFLDNYLEFLKPCKAVISLAGHSTISESLCYKKPLLVIPILNHIEQLTNASMVERLDYGKAVFLKGDENDLNLLKRKLKAFFKKEEYYQEVLNSTKINCEGVEESIKHIQKLLNKINKKKELIV